MFICPHVHGRDWDEAHKETLEHLLKVAEIAGFTAVIAMPNTMKQPITTLDAAVEYVELAKKAKSPVKFYVHMGLTNDEHQVREAFRAVGKIKDIVGYDAIAGVKQYCCHSTNNMGVTCFAQRKRNLEIAVEENYTGVFIVHAEHHDLCKDNLFEPKNPRTHAEYCRPPVTEVKSVDEQIKLAKELGYKGTLHIAHISVPESVYLVEQARQDGLKVTCGVTLQHLLLDVTSLNGEYGLYRKCNPPVRPHGMNHEMLELLRNGLIDFVETDHAPHTLDEKIGKALDAKGNQMYASGMTALQLYPLFVDYLRNNGFTEQRIHEVTFSKANELFKLGLTPRVCVPRACPEEYTFNPYKGTGVLE